MSSDNAVATTFPLAASPLQAIAWMQWGCYHADVNAQFDPIQADWDAYDAARRVAEDEEINLLGQQCRSEIEKFIEWRDGNGVPPSVLSDDDRPTVKVAWLSSFRQRRCLTPVESHTLNQGRLPESVVRDRPFIEPTKGQQRRIERLARKSSWVLIPGLA